MWKRVVKMGFAKGHKYYPPTGNARPGPKPGTPKSDIARRNMRGHSGTWKRSPAQIARMKVEWRKNVQLHDSEVEKRVQDLKKMGSTIIYKDLPGNSQP